MLTVLCAAIRVVLILVVGYGLCRLVSLWFPCVVLALWWYGCFGSVGGWVF